MKRICKEMFMRMLVLGLLLAASFVMASNAFAFETDGSTAEANNPPVAKEDQVTININSSTVINVLENDSDIDGDPLVITGVTQGGNGTVSVRWDGAEVKYVPNENFLGFDTFTYSISDSKGGIAAASVTINVIPKINNPPVAVEDQAFTNESVAVTIYPLLNDYDIDGDILRVYGYSPSSNGTLSYNDDGTFTYTPNPGFIGTDFFCYAITDGNGGASNTSVKITVFPKSNNPPIAVDDLTVTDEATPVNINPLFNDFDLDNDSLKIVSYSQGANGTVTDNENGTLNYTPKAGFSGSDIFYYKITDGKGGYASAKITVMVNPIITIGFMTGGGSIYTGDGMRVTHGFTLRANVIQGASNLEINWDKGHKFHLVKLTYINAYDDPNINSAPPSAGFDTIKGTGIGSYNGVTGAVVEFIFTDAGEPGISDTAKIIIKDSSGNVLLAVSGKLDRGNHQAHN